MTDPVAEPRDALRLIDSEPVWERVRRAKLKPVEQMNIEVRNRAGDHVAIHDIPVVREGGVVISRVMHAGEQRTRRRRRAA